MPNAVLTAGSSKCEANVDFIKNKEGERKKFQWRDEHVCEKRVLTWCGI